MIILRNGKTSVKASCATEVLKHVSNGEELNQKISDLSSVDAILLENIFHLLPIESQIKLIETALTKTGKLYIHSLFATPFTYVHYESIRYLQHTEHCVIAGLKLSHENDSTFDTTSFVWEFESICQYIRSHLNYEIEVFDDFEVHPNGCERLILIKK